MPKSALVTGACGFTGTNMVDYLLDAGWKVIATDLKKDEHGKYYCEAGDLYPSHYQDYIEGKDVTFVSADLTARESLKPLFEHDFEVIFHIASLYDYFATWDVLYKVNVEGTGNLAELALEKGVKRFVHWSTDGVYGEIEDGPGDETHPHNPQNLYSRSKSEQEKVLWELHREKNLPLTVLRPAPIYGPRHRYGAYHILYTIRKMGTGLVIPLFPRKHTLMWPSTHVIDLVRAAAFMTEKEESIGEAYNVLSDCITQAEFAEFIYKAMGVRYYRIPVWWPIYKWFSSIALRYARYMDGRARAKGVRPKIDLPMVEYVTHQYWFSNQKLKDLGFKFIYQDPREGIWEYITWCKERGWL